jgi:hypothetical protein
VEQKKAERLMTNTEGYLKGTFMKIYSLTQKRDLFKRESLDEEQDYDCYCIFSMCSGPVGRIRM